MKRLLILFLVCFPLIASVDTYASDDTPDSDTTEVEIEVISTDSGTKGDRPRAPRYIDIEVFYCERANLIIINYRGEDNGEVYIYKDNIIVGYSSEINTSILLPADKGTYKIEIITDTWIASGYLDI